MKMIASHLKPVYTMKKYGIFFILCFSLYGNTISQTGAPVLFIHPRQLMTSGRALEGFRVSMEVAFAYRASIQKDSLYQRCTFEGKFRESGLVEDEVMLYNVMIPNNAFVHYYNVFKRGAHFTLTGSIREAKGPWSLFIVEEIAEGWKVDTLRIGRDSLDVFSIIEGIMSRSPDSVKTFRPDSGKKLSGAAGKKSIPDSASQKNRSDSSWVK